MLNDNEDLSVIILDENPDLEEGEIEDKEREVSQLDLDSGSDCHSEATIEYDEEY